MPQATHHFPQMHQILARMYPYCLAPEQGLGCSPTTIHRMPGLVVCPAKENVNYLFLWRVSICVWYVRFSSWRVSICVWYLSFSLSKVCFYQLETTWPIHHYSHSFILISEARSNNLYLGQNVHVTSQQPYQCSENSIESLIAQ